MKPPGKKETLLEYLGRGIAMLHVDARRPGVAVPAQHAGDPHLRINLSFRYGIPDLVIDDRRVQATLSFGGRPFQCQLPWAAVFGITSQTSGDGQVWPEDLPTEALPQAPENLERRKDDKLAPEPAAKRKRPALVAVERDERESEVPTIAGRRSDESSDRSAPRPLRGAAKLKSAPGAKSTPNRRDDAEEKRGADAKRELAKRDADELPATDAPASEASAKPASEPPAGEKSGDAREEKPDLPPSPDGTKRSHLRIVR